MQVYEPKNKVYFLYLKSLEQRIFKRDLKTVVNSAFFA